MVFIYHLMEHLQSNTFSSFFNGQKLISLKRVSSTNDYLKQELSKSAPFPEGTVIMAEEQHMGRGQVGNRWEGEPGKNLTFSLLLRPDFLPAHDQFKLNIAISTAIHRVLSSFLGEAVKLKWPNDILVADCKLGGILIENSVQGTNIRESVIGIGINVNQTDFEFAPRACSIKQLLHREYILTDLLYELCSSIEQSYRQLKTPRFLAEKEYYITHLYGLGENKVFRQQNSERIGKIEGVDSQGRLIIRFENGSESFAFKEIEMLY